MPAMARFGRATVQYQFMCRCSGAQYTTQEFRHIRLFALGMQPEQVQGLWSLGLTLTGQGMQAGPAATASITPRVPLA